MVMCVHALPGGDVTIQHIPQHHLYDKTAAAAKHCMAHAHHRLCVHDDAFLLLSFLRRAETVKQLVVLRFICLWGVALLPFPLVVLYCTACVRAAGPAARKETHRFAPPPPTPAAPPHNVLLPPCAGRQQYIQHAACSSWPPSSILASHLSAAEQQCPYCHAYMRVHAYVLHSQACCYHSLPHVRQCSTACPGSNQLPKAGRHGSAGSYSHLTLANKRGVYTQVGRVS